jgi:hypothetical protein
MKSFIFCDIRQCSPLKHNRRFGGIYRLYLQGRRKSQGRNHHEADSKQALLSTCLVLVSWRRHVPPKRRLIFNGLSGVVSQKRVPFSHPPIAATTLPTENEINWKDACKCRYYGEVCTTYMFSYWNNVHRIERRNFGSALILIPHAIVDLGMTPRADSY